MTDRATNLAEAKKKLEDINTFEGLKQFNQFMNNLGGDDLAHLQQDLRSQLIDKEPNSQFKAVMENVINIPNTQNPANIDKPIHDYMKTATPGQAMRNVFGGKSLMERALIAIKEDPTSDEAKQLAEQVQTEIQKLPTAEKDLISQASEELKLDDLSLDISKDQSNFEQTRNEAIQRVLLGAGRNDLGMTSLGPPHGLAVFQQFGPDIGGDLEASGGSNFIQQFTEKTLDTISHANADQFKLKAQVNLKIDQGEELDLKADNREAAEQKAEGPLTPKATPSPFKK